MDSFDFSLIFTRCIHLEDLSFTHRFCYIFTFCCFECRMLESFRTAYLSYSELDNLLSDSIKNNTYICVLTKSLPYEPFFGFARIIK